MAEPLGPWQNAVGLGCFLVGGVVAATVHPLALIVYVLGTAASAVLYRRRGESFVEGWATGAVAWPLSIPFAVWGLRSLTAE